MHGILQEGDLFSGLVYKSVFHDDVWSDMENIVSFPVDLR